MLKESMSVLISLPFIYSSRCILIRYVLYLFCVYMSRCDVVDVNTPVSLMSEE